VSTIEDLRDYLAAAGIGLTAGANLFGGTMPDKPDVANVLYDSSGGVPIDTGGGPSKPAVINPRVQVQSRATAYNTARDTCRAIYNALTLIANQTLSGHYYERVSPVQEPFLLHNDESNRTVFVCNFDVFRDPE
jgi:hypothetical protein